jgi:hypothetical protein
MTTAAPEVDQAFEAALHQDAQAPPPPQVPAPPPRATSIDPDAPHGRDDDGKPLAPFGLNKKTGRPNLKAAGPGRGKRRDPDAPRTTTPEAAPATSATTAAASPAGGRDYTADLAGLGTSVWIGASAVRGGKLPLIGVKVPDLRPYAMLWHEHLPQLVGAWNQAAQQNATVRGWVDKMAGDGSWQWVIGVSVVSANFLAGAAELAKKDQPGHAEHAELRARYAQANDDTLRKYLAAQVPELELGELELADPQQQLPEAA